MQVPGATVVERAVRRAGSAPADAGLALLLAGLAVSDVNARTSPAPLPAAVLTVLVVSSLAWRHRWPGQVAVAVCGLDLVLSATHVGPYPPQVVLLPVLLAVATAAADLSGRRAVAVGGSTLVLMVAALASTADGDVEDFLAYVLWGAAWGAGRLVRRSSLQAAAAAARAEQVTQQREADLREARQRERDRIARELHDVVAHAVSLMVVQAGAERLRLGTSAPRTTDVLDAVETAGREALADLRRMLGVLRDAAQDGAARVPQPQLGQLAALVDTVRSAGLPVVLDAGGLDVPVPDGVGLAAYRIVQEALTNVVRHGGSAPTTVRVRRTASAVEVEVSSRLAPGPPAQRSTDGRGVLGMRERAALHGGHLQAGPVDGAWVVRAELPVPVVSA